MINKKQSYMVLLCSLLMNVFLLGIIVSSHVRTIKTIHSGNPVQQRLIQLTAAKEILSPEYQDMVEEIWKAQRGEIRNEMFSMMTSIQNAHKILTAPEFNPQALESLQAKMDSHSRNIKSGFLTSVHEIAVKLPPEERIKYFEKAISTPPFPMMGAPMMKSSQ